MDDFNEKLYLMKQERNRGRWQGVIITVSVMAVLFLFGFLWHKLYVVFSNGIRTGLFSDSYKSRIITDDVDQKLGYIEKIIDTYYLEDVDEDAMKEGIYKGVISNIGDDYAEYYTKEEFSDMMSDTEGVFEGIGALLQIDQNTGALVIVKPLKDSPAERAGILENDIIIEVDGEDIVGQDLNVVVSKIRGKKGSKVKLGVVREGEKDTLYFDIKRDTVESVTVEYEMLEDKIGYLMISEFSDNTSGQFKKALNSLDKDGMEGLIIDLRGNPGGNVDTAVEIADVMLPEGTVVYTIDKNNEKVEYESDANCYEIPCVILINQYTASAAEILSGAMQDYGKAELLGTTTYGKGIVQTVLSLGDGTGLKMTSAKYYTPNGINIHGVGIKPDIELEFDAERYEEKQEDNQKEGAIQYLKDNK
ncbi:MAG: S41 family peptidase [Lachnospiraceae bacterium]|nr:S41 family peptidase [Lachnospiraceae bacterium]